MVTESLVRSLRPPDRYPVRLASLTTEQEAIVRSFLESIAFGHPDTTVQDEAQQALEESWPRRVNSSPSRFEHGNVTAYARKSNGSPDPWRSSRLLDDRAPVASTGVYNPAMRSTATGLLTAVMLVLASVVAGGQTSDSSSIRNFLRVSTDFCTGGQPRPEHFAALKADGVKTVLSLRTPEEYRGDEEAQAVKAAGMTFINIPVVYSTPAKASVDEFLRVTDDVANRPIFIHCTAAIRVGAFWLIRRVLRDNWTWEAALAEARKIGLTGAPHLEEFARQYIAEARVRGTMSPAAAR